MQGKIIRKTSLFLLISLLFTGALPGFAKITDFKEPHTAKIFQKTPKREVLILAPGCNQGTPELLLGRPGKGRCHLKTRQGSTQTSPNLGLKAGNRNSHTAHHEGAFSSRQRGPALIQDLG